MYDTPARAVTVVSSPVPYASMRTLRHCPSRTLVARIAITVLGTVLTLAAPGIAQSQDEIFVADPNTSSVKVYSRAATGDSAPLREIIGDATGLHQVSGVAVDEMHGEIFVTDCCPASIVVHDRFANGNAPPRRVINTSPGQFSIPQAIALDLTHDEIIVGDSIAIKIYARNASGPANPLRVISGPSTKVDTTPDAVAVDPGRNEIYARVPVGIGGILVVHNRTANGNVIPLRSCGTGGVVGSGIALDAVNGEVFVTDRLPLSLLPFLHVFSLQLETVPPAGLQCVVKRNLGGSASGIPSARGVAVDTVHDEVLITDDVQGSISVFRRTDQGNVAPLRKIVGPTSRLSKPVAIAVASNATPPESLAMQFAPVTPCRVIDTRNPAGPFGGPFITAGTTRTIPVPLSLCGIPAGAAAYALNVTVVPRGGPLSYLTLWPTGQAQPFVSTLNSFDGSVLANAAIVPAGTSGAVDAFATNDTDLIIDINGYFDPPTTGTLQFYPLSPCRVLDTRNATGSFGGPPISANTFRSFPIPSSGCGAPPNASAYSLNATVVPHGGLGFLTAWPSGQPKPFVSTLNSFDGTVLANAAIVPAGTGGAVTFYASDTTDLVVDINGFFAAPGPGGLNFHTVPPCRLVDTRNGNGPLGGPIIAGNTARSFPLPTGPCGLPSTAPAYSLNITVVPSEPLVYLTAWPSGQAQPFVSTLNDLKGLPVANAALLPAGTAADISVFVTNDSHVVIDTNGYFSP